MNNEDRLRDHLNMALEQLLAAFVISGGDLGDEVPDTALDAALHVDPSVGIARQGFHVALRALGEPEEGEHRRQAVLALEEAVNALVVQSVDAAYRVGLRVGRGLRG